MSEAKPYRHIMAACDFSTGSDKAVTLAIDQARADGARLTVIHVLVPGMPVLPDQDQRLVRGMSDQEITAQLRSYMERQYLDKISGLKVNLVLRRGHPSTEIMAQLTQDPADLLVVGSQGLSGMGLVLFGSVAERLVRRGGCTTLIVR